MLFEMQEMPAAARYKLLTATITPRPVAWVTTLSAGGILNVAPFSCFNLMGHTPPMVAIGMQPRADGRLKDTCANIAATGEMTINLVTFRDAEAMVATSAEFPADVDEAAAAELTLTPSTHILPPRIATAPVSLECRQFRIIEVGPDQTIILGEVIAAHVKEEFVMDPDRCAIDTPALELVGRMQGPGWYVRCSDLFRIDNPA